MKQQEKQETCAERVGRHMEGRLEDLRLLAGKDQNEYHIWEEDEAELCDYGLCFEYVPADRHCKRLEGYYRWLISYGGPSDEFRFFVDAGGSMHKVEYWYMDWFDGAKVILSGSDLEFMRDLWEWFFVDSGAAEHALPRTLED